MAKISLVSAVLAPLALAGCGEPEPKPDSHPCDYKPIYDKSSALSDAHYPWKFNPPKGPDGSIMYGLDELKDPPEAEIIKQSDDSVRSYQPLEIEYSDPSKTTIAGCGLTLRTYNGKLVGPTLRVKPGQTLKFTVQNHLNQIPSGMKSNLMPPGDAMLDSTNLHTHGLEVSPGPNTEPARPKFASDNVMIKYGPGETQNYEIRVPVDHPRGTFWYHPHVHGSTAAEVSSGMVGALIVEDDRSDQSKLPNSLKNLTTENGKEKILVFQSTLYSDGKAYLDKVDKDHKYKNDNPYGPYNGTETPGVPVGGEGQIANLSIGRGKDQTWEGSQRRITINGQLVPKITMKPGEVQRWRMIGAMSRAIALQLADHDLHEIALDGHYLPKVDTWKAAAGQKVALQPGYRSDVLVQASSTPGTYMLMNNPDVARAESAVTEGTGTAPVKLDGVSAVAAVEVAGDPVQDTLPTDAQMSEIAYKAKPEDSLKDKWNEENKNNPADKQHIQKISFDVGYETPEKYTVYQICVKNANKDLDAAGLEKECGIIPLSFTINHFSYHETNDARKLKLGQVDRWDLTTAAEGVAPHLFHIHVNPFQVIRKDPKDLDELVWKDTILVPINDGNILNRDTGRITADPEGPKPIYIYTRYNEAFPGTFVMHCHYLDHEDDGMMEREELK